MIQKHTILITGATGKTGGAGIAELLQKERPVGAIVHTRDAQSEQLDRIGVETPIADMFRSEQLLTVLNAVSFLKKVNSQADLISRHKNLGTYWQAAQFEEINTKVSAEQLSAYQSLVLPRLIP